MFPGGHPLSSSCRRTTAKKGAGVASTTTGAPWRVAPILEPMLRPVRSNVLLAGGCPAATFVSSSCRRRKGKALTPLRDGRRVASGGADRSTIRAVGPPVGRGLPAAIFFVLPEKEGKEGRCPRDCRATDRRSAAGSPIHGGLGRAGAKLAALKRAPSTDREPLESCVDNEEVRPSADRMRGLRGLHDGPTVQHALHIARNRVDLQVDACRRADASAR